MLLESFSDATEISTPYVPTYDERIAVRVCARMEELGLSLPDVARHVGIPVESVSRVRNGSCNLCSRDLYALAAVLGISIEQLIGW